MENGIPALQNRRIFLKEIKIDLPYNPAIPYLDIYPKYMKLGSQRDISTPMFTAELAVLFIIQKKKQKTECPLIDKYKNKMCYTHTQ